MKDSQHIGTPRVLVATADTDVASELEGILTRLRYDVAVTPLSADRILRNAEITIPDLIVVDSSSTDAIDAMAVVSRISAEQALPLVYIIDSAWNSSKGIGQAPKPYGYLIRPFNSLQAGTTLESALDRHRTEMKLRENETRLELALSGGGLGLWDFSVETGRAFVSRRLAVMLGYEAGEVGADIDFWKDLFPEEDLTHARDLMKAHLEGRTKCFELELRLRTKAGNWKWGLARGKVGSRDAQGNPLRVIGTLLDITDRRLAENITRAQRDLSVGLSTASDRQDVLRLCIDAALCISGMDSAGIYVANRDGGLDLAAHRGLTAKFVEQVAHLGPETPQVQVVSQGRPIYSERPPIVPTSENLMRHEGLTSLAVIPMFFEGCLGGCLNVASHRFERIPDSIRNSLEAIALVVSCAVRRLAAEEEAGRNAAQFRELAELLPQTVFEADATGKFTFVNRYGLEAVGRTEADVDAGLTAYDMVVPEQQELISESFTRNLRGELNIGTEYSALRTDGTTFPVAVYSNPIAVEGEIVGIRGVCVDISELKEAQDRINVSLKEKEVLLREIHHRVKNNLQVISSLLRLQARYVKTDAPGELFRDAENRIRSMALVHEKLYASRYISKLNVAEYLKSLVNSLKASYGTGHGSVVFKQNVDDIELDPDTAIPVGFIVTELVSNCLKHAFPAGCRGRISIGLQAVEGNCFRLVVSDDGLGIDTHFDPDNPTSFGLHLVRMLSQQMDGDIEIRTDGGTEFRITFKEIPKRSKHPFRSRNESPSPEAEKSKIPS